MAEQTLPALPLALPGFNTLTPDPRQQSLGVSILRYHGYGMCSLTKPRRRNSLT